MYFLYILECDDGSLYTGISPDVETRFVRHQRGKGAKYTRLHKPTKILHTEQFPSKSDAMKREMEIKSWSRQKKLILIQLGHS